MKRRIKIAFVAVGATVVAALTPAASEALAAGKGHVVRNVSTGLCLTYGPDTSGHRRGYVARTSHCPPGFEGYL
ncbi:hypothetical protein ABT294_39455 [Nonomuraea sp. NPDC000554]|uniref:hypothetical protein n=1 Tax=Nonomuraea sp. NPDC000554 TaxID=3154259 RepID=UPI00332C563E